MSYLSHPFGRSVSFLIDSFTLEFTFVLTEIIHTTVLAYTAFSRLYRKNNLLFVFCRLDFSFLFDLFQITTVEEAKEFYPLFGLGANIALIFSGRTVKYFSNLRKNLGPGVDGWAISLKGMMSIVVILGLVISGIYWGVNKFVLSDPSLPKSDRKKKKVGCIIFPQLLLPFLFFLNFLLIFGLLFYRRNPN